jgi:hypothetical protein
VSESPVRKPGGRRNEYFVYHKTSAENGPAGRYLVNDKARRSISSIPGINGIYDKRPDGSSVQKFTAPKATLMSYIIKGISERSNCRGACLARRFHLDRARALRDSSLAFAVGVYLADFYVCAGLGGGLIRWLVDQYTRRKHAGADLTEDQLVAEGDKSNGVLLSSGYIAGGTLAGVVFAFMNIPLKDRLDAIEKWATAHNPFFEGAWSDLLALVPFAASVRSALSRRTRCAVTSRKRKSVTMRL